jgi:Rieske 2Fe-2S family protein
MIPSQQSCAAWVAELVARQRPGWSLEQPFYTRDEIYCLDIERIWRRGWLFAGHSCQVPRPGDYLTLDVDADSILIVRGDGGEVHALHNVCRHRGTRLCAEEAGHVGRIVCPYHQWTYARDGRLLHCRGMQENLDKSQFGLHAVHVREVEGLIYVSLAADPPPFEPAQELFESLARPQGLARARVAKVIDYTIPANWKLVWENNRECWHCNVNHPQYIRANYDHYNADDTPERVKQQVAAAVARNEAEWAAAGLAVTFKQHGLTPFPDAARGVWYSANRTPLADGYVSETMDGRQAAPLMGDYTRPTVGTLRMRSLPNFWNHSSCDHAVTTRLLPAGPQTTRAHVTWLVHADAVEGKDYDVAKLLPFWQLTSEQDWEICKNQQLGVNSSAYTPGPYSTYKEYNVAAFVRWYLAMLGKDST